MLVLLLIGFLLFNLDVAIPLVLRQYFALIISLYVTYLP